MSSSTLSSQGLGYRRTCHTARQQVEANEFLNRRSHCSHILTENGISCLECCTFYLAVIWICLWITFKQWRKIQVGFYVDIRQTPVPTVHWKASLKPGVSCRHTCLCLHRWALQCQHLLALRPGSTEQLRSIPSSSTGLWNAVAATKLPVGKGLGLVWTSNQHPGVSAACLPGPELCQGDGIGKAVPVSRCSPRHPGMQCTGVQGTQSSHRAGLCLEVAKLRSTLSQILHSWNTYFCGFLLAEVLNPNSKEAQCKWKQKYELRTVSDSNVVVARVTRVPEDRIWLLTPVKLWEQQSFHFLFYYNEIWLLQLWFNLQK